jgi:NAD-dependent SIR2 family protein deacetylase
MTDALKTVTMESHKVVEAERDKYRVELETQRLEKEEYRKQAEQAKSAAEELEYKFKKERETVAAYKENIDNLHAEIESLNGLRQINNDLLAKLRLIEEAK